MVGAADGTGKKEGAAAGKQCASARIEAADPAVHGFIAGQVSSVLGG